MNLPFADIQRLIEEYGSDCFNSGFTAGVEAAKNPWQHMISAPKDGTAIIVAIGTTRVTVAYWDMRRGCWNQHGTGRAILPTQWMALPKTQPPREQP